MKHLIFIALILSTSCAKYATKEEVKATDNRIDTTNTKVDALTHRINSLEYDFNSLKTSLNGLSEDITLTFNDFNTSKNALQASLDTIQQEITELQLNRPVIDIIDPCPNPYYEGYAEVFMQLNNGQYVAYFESESTRHLTVLKKNQLYSTTDTRHCRFKINNANQVEVF
jgi:seryl-tRNA synthetase